MATGDKIVTLDGLKAVYDSQDTDGIKQDVADLKSSLAMDETYTSSYSHGNAVYVENYSVPVNISNGQDVVVTLNDENNPSKTFVVYVKYVGSSTFTMIGRANVGTPFNFTATSDIFIVGFYAEGLTSGVLESTIVVKSAKSIVDEITEKVDKNGNGEVTTRNIEDVQSNVLFHSSEITVESTDAYVYDVVYRFSGPFVAGDKYTILYDSITGATATTPFAIWLEKSDGTRILDRQFPDVEITQSYINQGLSVIRFALYPAKGVVLPSGSATYTNVKIVKGEYEEASLSGTLRTAVMTTVGKTDFSIPSYYFDSDYIQNKVQRIAEISKACAGNGDSFIFITDEHFDFGYNQKHSPALINYLNYYCNIPRLFDGGDSANGLSIDFIDDLRNAYNHPIHHVLGNHDWMLNRTGDYLAYYCDSFAYNQIGNAEKHYYYVDNDQKKIRYIILNAWKSDLSQSNTLVSAYDAEQLSWFTNTALNVENGWGIIIFTHFIKAGNNVAPDGASDFLSAIDNYSGNGEIICIVEGHTHYDSVSHTTSGIPIINTTCDKNKSWFEGTTNMEPWLDAQRPDGTIYEQAFDVVCINRTSRTITAIRIGALAMNNVDKTFGQSDFTTTGTLEERTITY